MTAWTSFALRPNTTTQEGQVPVSGELVACPDIIPQTAPVQDPQGTFSTPDSWATTYPGQVTAGVANYLYLRAKNWAPGAETTTARMYAVGCALVQFPSDWLNSPLSVQLPDGTTSTTLELAATANQQVVVGEQPFYWQAPPPPAGSDHYCIFALLDSPDAPNQLLHSEVPQTYSDMASLVTNELYVGWKNVAEVSPGDLAWTHQMRMPLPPRVNPTDLLHVYFVGSKGLVGGSASMSCGDGVGYNPPINVPQTNIVDSYSTYGVLVKPSPSEEVAVLNLSFWKGSSNPGFSDRLSVICGWVPSDAALAEPFVASGAATELPEHHQGHELLGGLDVAYEVTVGAMHYVFSGA